MRRAGMPALSADGQAALMAYDEQLRCQHDLRPATLRNYSNNAAAVVNDGDRYRHGERIGTAFTESTINQVVSKRMVKKPQMQWSPAGAQLLLQVRTQVLNDDWEATFRSWYPGFRPVQPVICSTVRYPRLFRALLPAVCIRSNHPHMLPGHVDDRVVEVH